MPYLAPKAVIRPRARGEAEIPLKFNPTSASAKGSAKRQSMPLTVIRAGLAEVDEGFAVRGVGAEGNELVTTLGVVSFDGFWGLTA